MTRNEKVFLAIIGAVLVTIFTIGATNVFAETEETVIIPFEPLGRVCGYDITGTKWICEWDPNRIILEDVFTANNTAVDIPKEASTTLCPDRFYLIDDGITCMPINCEDGYHHNTSFECVEDEKPKEPVSVDHQRLVAKLDYYENNPPKTFDQLNEKWKLEHLSLCWYGKDQGRGIQQQTSFVTSTWIEDQDKVYASNVYLIDRAITICTAQTTILEILGDKREPGDVRTQQGWWGVVIPTHGELAKDVPQWSQNRVNTEANLGIRVITGNPICEPDSYYGAATKRMYCTDEFAPVNIHGNMITTQNDIEDRWLQFKEDGGEAQRKEIQADIIAALRNKMIGEKLWKPSGVTDTDQIRSIENAGWSMYPTDQLPKDCYNWQSKMSLLQYLQRCGE